VKWVKWKNKTEDDYDYDYEAAEWDKRAQNVLASVLKGGMVLRRPEFDLKRETWNQKLTLR